jgi:hypothetical protein
MTLHALVPHDRAPRALHVPRAPRRALLVALVALVALPPCTAGLQAQGAASPTSGASSATLRGRVVDKAAAAGLARAEIVLVRDGRNVAADSTGRFVFQGVPSGPQQFVVRALGFAPSTFRLDFYPGDDLNRLIELDSTRVAQSSAQEVEGVKVTAAGERPHYRMVDFDRRRRTGRGQYLDEEQIDRTRANTLPDLTRGMRGVSTWCGGGGGCRIHMVRAQPGCDPEYIVDGRVDNMFGRYTPIRDIIGLEIYTGPSDVPGEFAGTNAGCGVIVIWTRAGPTPRKKD